VGHGAIRQTSIDVVPYGTDENFCRIAEVLRELEARLSVGGLSDDAGLPEIPADGREPPDQRP